MLRNNISWDYGDLSEEIFLGWLPYYERKMQEHNYIIRATPQRYKEEVEKGFHLKYIFLYQNGKMIGTSIFGMKDKVAYLLFKASDRIDISSRSDSSLGSLIEFMTLRAVSKEGILNIKTKSPNAFGVLNTLGYLDFRLRFGYMPSPNPDFSLLDDVPVNDKGFVLFYGIQNGEFSLFTLQPKVEKNEKFFEKSSFVSYNIPFKEIYY